MLTAAAVAVAVAACGSSSNSSPAASSASSAAASTKPGKLVTTGKGGATLRVGDQAGTGAQSLLTAAGLLNKLPFKISWADFTSGPPMLQAMAAGDLDIGGVGDSPPVFAAAGGAKIAIVGAVANDPNSAALVVPKNSPIKSISQLKGKKIAVAQGSSADYHLLTVLSKAGLTPRDVTLDYLQPAEGLAALSSGAVDAWDIWSPFIEEAVLQHGDRILVNGNGYGSNYSYEVASRSAISNPTISKEISEFLKVLDQAHIWANTHSAAWGKVWAAATGLPVSTGIIAAKDDRQHAIPVTSATTSAEQSLVDAFSKAGLIPSDYSFSKYINTSFNSTVSGSK